MFNDQEKQIINDVLIRIQVGGKLPTPLLYPVLEAKVQLYYSSKHIQIELAKLGLNLTVNNINLILHKNRKKNKEAKPVAALEKLRARIQTSNTSNQLEKTTEIVEEKKEIDAMDYERIVALKEIESRKKRMGFDQFEKL